ncbi:MAG: hypothetical protein J7K33_01265 [Candidatus Marinimicrobia bacterium]|nr:hypothetical protein [Candidatus Neomarinimicrobiota bacterium]
MVIETLNLNEVEEVLEKMKLRFLIQEKGKAAGVDSMDSVVLLRDEHLLVLLLLEKRPRKKQFISGNSSDLEFWFVWRDEGKVYVQKAGDEDVIPLEFGEVDAFIDLRLQ